MKSETAERILEEASQETKDKVRETANEMVGINPQTFKIVLELSREHQLLRLGFEKNQHQETFIAFKYDRHWYVDFWEVEELDGYEWSVLMEHLIKGFKTAKKHWYDGLREHSAYKFRAKEDKKHILDLLNKYRSWLQQETQCKMGKRSPNFARELELKSKISILKGVYDSKRNI